MNDLNSQINQYLTPEQIAVQEAANRSAQFLNKSMALGHQPEFKPVEPEPEHSRQFDREQHRAFMRSLG